MVLQKFSTDISKMKKKKKFLQFFKFSSLEQLWALKSIACVDNKVVSVSYSFQNVWMDLERELDLYTK